MISRTGYLILGLLIEGPLTGYLIRKITLARFRFFWNESYGQIYPQLKKLSAEGLVKAVEDGDARGSVRYALTAKGRKAFEAWLDQTENQDQLRLESILKIYMGAASRWPGCGSAIDAFGRKSASALAEMEKMREELESSPDPHSNHRNIARVLDLGIRTYRAWTEWAAENAAAKEVR
jgi:DNA-binding PadR family transcriptional regulator